MSYILKLKKWVVAKLYLVNLKYFKEMVQIMGILNKKIVSSPVKLKAMRLNLLENGVWTRKSNNINSKETTTLKKISVLAQMMMKRLLKTQFLSRLNNEGNFHKIVTSERCQPSSETMQMNSQC